jgi:AraC-like DNA-binding protein
VFDHIDAQLTRPIDLAELSGIAAMSKYHFLRLFRRMCGITPYRLFRQIMACTPTEFRAAS